MQHREIVSEQVQHSEQPAGLSRSTRPRAESRRAMRRALDASAEALDVPLDHPAREAATVLAGCRASWHEPLCREARTALGASVYAFDEPLSLVCAACEILMRGGTLDLVILDSGRENLLAFLRDVAPEVPVVLVGCHDDLEARIRAASWGAAAFLAEPVTVSDIIRVGRAFVGPNAAHAVARGIPIPLHLLGMARG